MAKKPGSLDNWRNYFRTADSDIFGVIDHAITVAASDCPKEFRLRRDRIAERLFTCGLARCPGCDRASDDDDDDDDDGADCDDYVDVVGDDDDAGDERELRRGGLFDAAAGASKESKVNSSSRDEDENLANQVSNVSFGDAEALTDEIEEESQIVGEVFRIKEILQHSDEQEPDSVLFDSLRRLQLMGLTVDTLKATEIGKAVNGYRKHGSKEIRNLARTLIDGWKDLVDEWVNATAAVAATNCTEGTPDSVNPSVLDEEEGLPSPPLDDLVFFSTQPTSMELSGFFDGMDDDGNPRNSGEFSKYHEIGRKPPVEDQNVAKRKQKSPVETRVLIKENKSQQSRRQEGVPKPTNRPLNAASGPGRPPKASAEHKLSNEPRSQQRSDRAALQKRPVSHPQEKLKGSNEDAVQDKLEATKRKLQERYQQAENAKKQRTIQVMEIHDLPKQNVGHRYPHIKPGNHNRHWAHVRR